MQEKCQDLHKGSDIFLYRLCHRAFYLYEIFDEQTCICAKDAV